MKVNQRFGRLLSVAEAGSDARKNRLWKFKCDCGNDYVTRATSVRNGYVVSCGCYRAEIAIATIAAYDGPNGNLKHGLRKTVEYEAWARMHQRCSNPNNAKFADYGGRGIKVCKRWHNFEAFYSDMGLRPTKAHSLDRKNNNGDYRKGNCRWALPAVQTRNKRSNIIVTYRGSKMILKDACKLASVNYLTVYRRLQRGWPLDRALA